MPFLNLSTALGPSNSIYYNTSYIIANQPPQMTTQTVWLATVLAGMSLLLLSRVVQEPTFKDLAGVMAAPLLLLGAIQAFAIDVVTGIVMATDTSVPYLGTIIETHTIYHYDLFGVIIGIFFALSLANLYLLWLDHKRLSEQEQHPMDRMTPNERNKPPQNTSRGQDDDKE